MKKKIGFAALIVVLAMAALLCVFYFGTNRTRQKPAGASGNTEQAAQTDKAQEDGATADRTEEGLLVVSAENYGNLFSVSSTQTAGTVGDYLGNEVEVTAGVSLKFQGGSIDTPYELVVPGTWEGQIVVDCIISEEPYLQSIKVEEACEGLSVHECETLERLTLSSSVKELDLMNCPKLTECSIPEESCLTYILGLDGLTALEKLELPASVRYISKSYFLSGLKEVDLPEGVVMLAGAFQYCDQLEVLNIPDSVTTIEGSCFKGDDQLTLIVGHDTEAERYAKEHDIPYRYREE
jgi:hypothetical protein